MQNEEQIKKMSTRQYLDSTMNPIIMQALTQLAKQRPSKPIQFLANYLLKNNPSYKKQQ